MGPFALEISFAREVLAELDFFYAEARARLLVADVKELFAWTEAVLHREDTLVT